MIYEIIVIDEKSAIETASYLILIYTQLNRARLLLDDAWKQFSSSFLDITAAYLLV